MTQARLPWLMGLTMGLMLPFVLHNGAGLMFVLVHVAIIAAALIALTFAPLQRRLRAILTSHRPSWGHVTAMSLAAGPGFAMICTYCLLTGGTHHG